VKTLLVAFDYPPMGGGIARALSELARPEALDPDLVHTGPAGWSRDRLKTLGGTIAWSREVERLAAAQRIEFTWAGNLKPAGYVARWLQLRRKVPYGIILYGHDLLRLRVQARRSVRKRLTAKALLQGAEVLVGISGWTADLCRTVLHEVGLRSHASRVLTVPLGADPERFTPAGPRAPLGPGRWLLTVARLVPHKGIDTALEALAQLGPGFDDVRYAIVGDGPDTERLSRIVRERGLGARVRFVHGVPDSELPSYYRTATLYLGLSRAQGDEAEGFGLSLVEAQACSVPVLGARSGGIADAMRDGETGWLVPADDPTATAVQLRQLLAAPEAMRTAGQAGRQLVERELNWRRVGQALKSAQLRRGGR
jgi:phosphatidylinositol alpha-1,6-mannosyltransferase